MSSLSPSDLGRELAALRLTNGGGTGRPAILRTCPKCLAKITARQARLKCPHTLRATAAKEQKGE